ncbi:hypothetical protein [Streptomyces sp. NPDC088360]|uniref:hypothetical protein n=1 Tax=Streptomyces sp. NPDC088360 TaxID=3154515 RepID=UPI00344D29B7
MGAVDQLHKLLGEVNRLEGYNPATPRPPMVVPFCKLHKLSYAPESTMDGLLVCAGCLVESDARRARRVVQDEQVGCAHRDLGRDDWIEVPSPGLSVAPQ